MRTVSKICMILLVMTSCAEVEVSDSDVVALPDVKHGRLAFKDLETYSSFIEQTIDGDVYEVVHSLQGGFHTLRDHNRDRSSSTNAKSKDNDDEMDNVVWDPYFENLLNGDREIEILNVIYRITEVGVFFYTNESDKVKLDSIEAAWIRKYKKTGRMSEVVCLGQPYLVDDSINYLPGGNCDSYGGGGYYGGGGSPTPPAPPGLCGLSNNHASCPGSAKNIFGVNHTCELYLTGTGDRRIKGKFWSQNYVIFSSAGTNTRSQNHWLGAWWAEKADQIYLTFEGEIEQKDPFNNYWTYQVATDPIWRGNENEISRTFEWASAIVGTGCDPVTGQCKPKFKPASPFKIKSMRTCHYVLDEGRHAEVALVYQ
jgi:hypothetical protein